MTTCPKCGMAYPDETVTYFGRGKYCDSDDECAAVASAYQRGRRDGIDEGVRIAKTSAVIRHYMKWPEGEWTNIDWSDVDSEAEARKEKLDV